MAGMAGGKGSWIGGLINTLFGIGSAYENAQVSKAWSKSARANVGTIMATGGKMIDAATQDWEHFKSTFAPVEQARAARADRDPDVAGAEGAVAGSVASGMSQGMGMAGQGKMRRGINPNSGNFSATLNDITVAGGQAGGMGMGRARRGEEDRVFHERAGVAGDARRIPAESSVIRARNIDNLQTTARKAAGLADAYSQRAADSLYNVGRGVGQMSSLWNQPTDSANQSWSNSSMENGTISAGPGYVENAEQYSGYADGGMVSGPGTGRSDSIPAMIDDAQPARVSNGEFIIPAAAVRRIGKRYLDSLVQKYHRPAAGRVIDGQSTHVE